MRERSLPRIVVLMLVSAHAGASIALPAAADALLVPQFGGVESARVGPAGPCLDDAQRTAIRARIEVSRGKLGLRPGPLTTLAPTAVSFGWPLRLRPVFDDPGYHGISNFVDHDFDSPNLLLDYQCGTRTYDLSGYNHSGTDIFTWPFGWRKMDGDEVEIVAAAPGVILFKDDGNFDRNCGFGGGDWNAVYVQHADGSVAWYGHMKYGSTIAKEPGAPVAQGEVLGIVGSSGNSTGPHLHLEIYDAAMNLIDPWSGPCNGLSATSWWAVQRPYYDSALNALRTHDAPPEFPPCPASEITHERDAFAGGERIYFAAYYRDQLQGQLTTYRVYDAAGTLRASWSGSSAVAHYAASYWYWWIDTPPNVPSPGFWRFEATYQSTTVVHRFWHGSLTAVPGDPSAGGALALAARGANPAQGAVELDATLPVSAAVRLTIVDARGRRVALLADGWYPAGTHRFRWDAAAPAGIYLARLESSYGAGVTRKVIVLD